MIIKNPYDCSVCDNEDCSGCGESAYESGYEAGLNDSELYKALKGLMLTTFAIFTPEYKAAKEAIAKVERGHIL